MESSSFQTSPNPKPKNLLMIMKPTCALLEFAGSDGGNTILRSVPFGGKAMTNMPVSRC